MFIFCKSLPCLFVSGSHRWQVAYFDAAESQWRLDALTITDAKFSAADRSLSFLMMANRLAPVSV